MTPSKILFYFCLFFIGGVFLYSLNIDIQSNQLKEYFDKEVNLIGVVIEEPDKRQSTTKLTIQIEGLEEKILITKWHYPQYEYGDKLKIKGSLQEPQTFEGFNYKDYLAKDKIFALMYQPKIELIEKNQASSLKRFLISAKNKLKTSLNTIMPMPQSGFLEALLFGDESNISNEWKDKLNFTGTRHIAAVSGMNITILCFLLSDFLLSLGFWKNQSFYISVILISFYILMIGAPASAVRAGIMAIAFLTAQHFGRISTGSRIIVLSATIMLIFNPLLLVFDIGFQLSFLAIMGLIYLQPILLNLFKKIPDVFQLRYNLSGTLAAQIFTLPILIYNFGQISTISLLANILILPLLPAITILGFIFSITGMVWELFGQFLSWPAWFMLAYLIKIIDWFSKISWANLIFQNVNIFFLLVCYFVLALMVWRIEKGQKLKFLEY